VHIVALADRAVFPALARAIEEGWIDDVLETPIDLDRALHRILVGRKSLDLRQRLESREAPAAPPTRDPVTGLWNRGSAVDLLRRELAAARRTGAHVGLVRLRVIGLEQHVSPSAADLAFRLVADALRVSVRVSDWVARLGAHAFAVVLPGCAEPRTIAIGERIFRLATERLESSGVFASLRVEAEAFAIAPDHPDCERIIAGLEQE
jgi:diguanylate cyclase (GGDEF)-like protein